ncbi:hypothetical protein N7508_010739 [Penicillium antarcticum]|uniref:uncharacterized protein n=1 Tax=Penicillium antarcticum TaxID=416450 RepID=UPI002385BD7B|nr:uncharacterized protein N7508_010739 [Penicillium antarcticum]KAJ5295918.1 hypothetical protein N7508_010739 [Penicillium antarcticum]
MAAFPPCPLVSLNGTSWVLLLWMIQVNGHVESKYSIATGEWSKPHFVEDPFIKVHGLAPGLNYGQQAFEGMKAYRDPDGQIQVFRLKDHAARLALSCSTIAIPTIPEDVLLASINLAVVLFGSDAFFAVFAGTSYRFCVYVQPYKAYHGVQLLPALVLEDLDRAAPQGVGHVKVGGNYAPVLKWSDKARAEGFAITLHLDSRTQSEIDEFSTSGFLGLKKTGDSFTLIVPSSPSILKSVTSTSCVELARSFGWAVELRPIPYLELPHFKEILAAGTAAIVVPIKSITRRSTGDVFTFSVDGPGEACQRLSKALLAVQKGLASNDGDWL